MTSSAITTGANACGATLAAGSSCSIYVTFTPGLGSQLHGRHAKLVADNATGSPQTAALMGTGALHRKLVSPELSVFPNTLTGTTSAALAATLSNTGNAPPKKIILGIAGANPSDFAITTVRTPAAAALAAGSS